MQLATCFIVFLISLEIICRSQGHIHANSPKNEGKTLFQVCHIIKIPLNGLTYNPAEHFTRFLHISKIRSKLVKYSAGLYVKPFNKIYLFEDKESIIRCDGRIQESPLPYYTKFPIMSPSHHRFRRLTDLRSN